MKSSLEIATLASQAASVDELLPRVLDFLSDPIAYDLAAVLALQKGRLVVRHARGPLATDAVKQHAIELAQYPNIRIALESRRTRVLQDHDHHREGDPYDGVLDLSPGHACMVVPLYAGDRTLGAMTFDRAACGIFEPSTVHLATVCGQILALAMLAAERTERLEQDNQALVARDQWQDDRRSPLGPPGEVWTECTQPEIIKVKQTARRASASDAPILIAGDGGTGKKLWARTIHAWSSRSSAPFVSLACTSIRTHEDLEHALLGTSDQVGRIFAATQGTLLLENIDALSMDAQTSLRNILEERRPNVRVMATTRQDLKAEVTEGRFHQDLWMQLHVFSVNVPPLNACGSDILNLAQRFLEQYHLRTGRGPWSLSPPAAAQLTSYPWPGNLEELITVLTRATRIEPRDALTLESIRTPSQPASAPLATLAETERAYFLEVLEHTGGKIYGPQGAAEMTGLKPSTLQSRLARLGIRRS